MEAFDCCRVLKTNQQANMFVFLSTVESEVNSIQNQNRPFSAPKIASG